ncbi:TPR repeat [Fulvimarina manganoxydans]|uniref:TPR repeat n=1 Tax=Fulvimarina manganoxydans TaxID=937218 RepID=A0A1W2ETW4_9HYPH|nr:SEL1-like repeat protein [Fulvimarina manganoxydans]SMD13139.1 TPR repeat [Fulvimarina manganoxydans]
MTLLRATIAAILVVLPCSALAQGREAEKGAETAQRYEAERVLLDQLRDSRTEADRRRLAEMFVDGVVAGPDNPLRMRNRDTAIAIYKALIRAGDRSPSTVVRLGKLQLTRTDDDELKPLVMPLRAAVFAGNGDAAYVLAGIAERGLLLGETSVQMLQTAALLGNVPAAIELARSSGLGATFVADVLQRLTLSASAGDAGAMVGLGRIHESGGFVPRDLVEARKWYEAAVATGDPSAMTELGSMLLTASAGEFDPLRASQLLTSAAWAGEAKAALMLGLDAANSGPMGTSIEVGRRWLERATEVRLRGAASHLAALDLRLALSDDGPAPQVLEKIGKVLAPIANDPEALADLAERRWSQSDQKRIGRVLLPMLHSATVAGSLEAGISYDIWLRTTGQVLPVDAAKALIDSLRRAAAKGTASATYTLASLALDGRIGQKEVPQSEAIDLLFSSADAQVGQAMLRIARMYAEGKVLSPSVLFAKRWFERAMEQKVESAGWELAALLSRSADPADHADARAFYQSQKQAGDPRGSIRLLEIELRTGSVDQTTLAAAEGEVVLPRDKVAIAKLLASSPDSKLQSEAELILDTLVGGDSDPDALLVYGRVLTESGRTEADFKRGVAMLEQSAQMGNLDAKLEIASTLLTESQFRDRSGEAVSMLQSVLAASPRFTDAELLLSDAYLRGRGVRADTAKAAELIANVLATEGDDPKATMLEADWLMFSEERRDPERAIRLLQQQADKGSLAATRKLGLAHLNGFGPAISPDRAVGYVFRAAEGGDKEAMAAMGHIFLNGVGINVQPELGVFWLRKAVEHGNTAASYDLSRLYALGALGEVDDAESAHWLRVAAERDHPSAAYQLGLSYLKGEGVAKDREEAIRWFRRSADLGNLLAGRTLKELTTDPKSDPAVAVEGHESE